MTSMEDIRDLDNHKLCEADPFRGILVKTIGRTEEMTIYLPIGGEVGFSRGENYTFIRRETKSGFRVNKYRQDTG